MGKRKSGMKHYNFFAPEQEFEKMISELSKAIPYAHTMSDIIRRAVDHFHTNKVVRKGYGELKTVDGKNDPVFVCEMDLAGTVVGNSCSYKTFELNAAGKVKEYDQMIPLSFIDKDIVDKQYLPSKEAVLKAKENNAQ